MRSKVISPWRMPRTDQTSVTPSSSRGAGRERGPRLHLFRRGSGRMSVQTSWKYARHSALRPYWPASSHPSGSSRAAGQIEYCSSALRMASSANLPSCCKSESSSASSGIQEIPHARRPQRSIWHYCGRWMTTRCSGGPSEGLPARALACEENSAGIVNGISSYLRVQYRVRRSWLNATWKVAERWIRAGAAPATVEQGARAAVDTATRRPYGGGRRA